MKATVVEDHSHSLHHAPTWTTSLGSSTFPTRYPFPHLCANCLLAVPRPRYILCNRESTAISLVYPPSRMVAMIDILRAQGSMATTSPSWLAWCATNGLTVPSVVVRNGPYGAGGFASRDIAAGEAIGSLPYRLVLSEGTVWMDPTEFGIASPSPSPSPSCSAASFGVRCIAALQRLATCADLARPDGDAVSQTLAVAGHGNVTLHLSDSRFLLYLFMAAARGDPSSPQDNDHAVSVCACVHACACVCMRASAQWAGLVGRCVRGRRLVSKCVATCG